MRVRRTAVPVLLWCLATAASIAVASLALRPVLHTAVPSDSVPMPAARATGSVAQPVPPLPSATATPSARSTPSGSTATPSAGSHTSAAPSTSTTTTTTATAPVRTVDGWTVTTGSDGVETYVKSFRSDGGDAVIRIQGGTVSLITATPREGYSVSRAQSEPTRLVVQFVAAAGNVAYLVDAMWWQDAPHGAVTKIGS